MLRHAPKLVYLLRDFIVAPQTFTKPKPRAIAAQPDLGERVRELPLSVQGRPAVVAFLRHVGCPFAEATVHAMTALATSHPTVAFIAVTHSAERPSRQWCDAFGGAGLVTLVPDPERAHYAAWGVGLTDRRHFAGASSLRALVRLLDEGIHNRWASGSRWQGAATFGIDSSGTIRSRHFPRHAGDLPPLDEAVRAIA